MPCTNAILVSLFAIAIPLPSQEAERPPNIILLFCDDLGYGDIGCFGSTKHRTPHIDSLARDGMKLTSFYSTSGVCTPSRSSLMTGCYPRRVNMHQSASGEWVLFPVARKGLNPSEVTVTEVLGERGYATACIGKWHLGDQPPFLPTRQGFQRYFGIPYSNDMGARQRKRNPPLPLMRGEQVIEAPVSQPQLTGLYTKEAIRFITENKSRPFFLNLPHTFPHLPLFASDGFKGKSANGRFGDTVEEIDWSTGRILQALTELGIAKDTIVMFTSDNGAASRPGGSNGPLRGHKGSTWEGGMRVPCVVRWPGSVPAGATCDALSSTLDLLPTFARFAGGAPPADRIIDGVDISSLLTGSPDPGEARDTFFYYFKDQLQAVRDHRWKLHLARKDRDRELPDRLFDLREDPGEQTDVAAANPEVVARLKNVAAGAREELGDRGRRGRGQRPAAIMEDPAPLIPRSPR